jgi:tRNA(Ile2) C34 agmatinyltransferase TiaS
MTTTANRIKVDFLVRPTFKCGRCGGNVVWQGKEDGYECVQCGRPHDNNGHLKICIMGKVK